jgi:RNA polymerase sigma factor (sigma-70 family)
MVFMLNTNAINRTALDLIPAIRQVYLRMGLRDGGLDDAVQNAFIHLTTYALPRWDSSKGEVKSYALRMAKNLRIDALRRESRRSAVRGAVVPVEAVSESDLLRQARSVAVERLTTAVSALTSEDREIVKAYLRTGTWAAAADELGMSPATMSRAKARIVNQLRELM